MADLSSQVITILKLLFFLDLSPQKLWCLRVGHHVKKSSNLVEDWRRKPGMTSKQKTFEPIEKNKEKSLKL